VDWSFSMSQKVATRPAPHPALIPLAALALAACEAPTQQQPGTAARPPAAATPPLALAAAAPAAEPLGEPKAPGDVTASYRCANGERLRVSYRSQDAAMISYRGETHFLPLARSASGARYAGDGWQWWIKGQAEGVLSRMPADVAVAPGAGVLCTAEMAVAPESQLRPAVKPAP
jgi:membrane-bound inhibitor of C-type lysozyme